MTIINKIFEPFFSTKEIGVVTQQTSATIYVRKTSIRKKINAGEKQDIVECIRGI